MLESAVHVPLTPTFAGEPVAAADVVLGPVPAGRFVAAGAKVSVYALTAPPQVTASSTSPTTANVTWVPVAGASGYRIERAAGTGSFAIIATLGDVATFADSGLTTNVSYRYRVTALGAAGVSDGSPVASVTPAVGTNVSAPTDLAATLASGSVVSLSWANTSSNEAVLVQRSLDGGITWTDLVSLSGATKTYNDNVNRATLYAYRLKASTYTAVSPYTGSVSLLTPPKDVASFLRTGITTTTAAFTWTVVAGATGYVIEQSKEGGAFEQVATVAGGILSTTISGLETGTLYQFRIRATNAGGASDPKVVNGVLTIPAAPGSLTLSFDDSTDTTGIKVTFAPVKGAASYILERQSDGHPWAKLATLASNATSYFDTQVVSGEGYDYRLIAVNESGQSDKSPEASTFITDNGVLPMPEDLAFTVDAKGLVTVTWTSPAQPSGFVVQRLTGSVWKTVATTPGSVNSATIKGLAVGTTTRVRVASLSDGGEVGSASDDIAVMLPPAAVKNIKLLGVPTNSSAVLTWTAPVGASKFKVERSSDGTNFVVVATDQPAAVYNDSSLEAGTSYRYRVTAGNDGGFGPVGSTFTLVTAPGVPTGVTVSASATAYTVSWGDIGGETGYRVQGSADGATWTILATTKPNVTSVTVKKTKKPVLYFRVASFNKTGTSNYTSPAQAGSAGLRVLGRVFSDNLVRGDPSNHQILL